jgi:bifunctional non-homologous end joining protein LigD
VSLRDYHDKRRFRQTPEPPGTTRAGTNELHFVVQKHQASRLHYDFRLELDGVLKSWAVPKGPTLDPHAKRLAVMVEDHPLEYREFEGAIPEGNYGAGTVMVWDRGLYVPVATGTTTDAFVAAMRAGLTKGHLRFALHGSKLRGEFSLVQLKNDPKNWLLIKHGDAFAGPANVLQQDRSALSGRTMDEIAGQARQQGHVWHAKNKPAIPAAVKTRAAISVRDAPRGPMPHRVKPMLATPVAAPFDGAGWIFEVKWDGYRAVAEVDNGKVSLYSRNHNAFESKYPALVQELAGLGHDAVLDGEVTVLDAEGKARFHLLQNYQKSRGNLIYYAFDLLYLDGRDLRDLPLLRRKELLAALIQGSARLRMSEHIAEHGRAFFKAVADQGLEGIVAKKANSPYREGVRGMNWLKIKARRRQEVVIGGFTDPRGSRQGFGALIIGTFEGKHLVYRGHAGGGFDDKSLAELRARLDALVQKDCPFEKKPKTNAPAHWVRPVLVCEVAFQEWSQEGSMRVPVFLGLREDIPPHVVTREVPKPLPATLVHDESAARPAEPAAAERSAPPGGEKHTPPVPSGNFTNLSKIYWPDDGYTKGDLLAYYHEVAPFVLPYLRERPLSLNRHPNGIAGPSFFQKDMSKQPPPAWVRTEAVPSDSRGTIRFLICDTEQTLLYVANLGCIELNPWNSRLASLERPDYLIIDLDPEGVPFTQVVEAAHKVRRLLEKASGECYCKTSGKRGLHIYMPLGARYPYEQARQFAELIARLVQRDLPATTSVARDPAQRLHKIYLDYLQNRRGQTIAAPYSVRPVRGATVSTPLEWREVSKRLDPTRFTIKTLPRRLEKKGDLWQPLLGPGFDLVKCLTNLDSRKAPSR